MASTASILSYKSPQGTPTAIGPTAPSLLLRAMREALKKYGLAACRTSPPRIKLINLVRDSTKMPAPIYARSA